MNKFRIAVLLLVAIVLLVAVMPVAAITDGELDGDGHPHVVLLVMDVGGTPTYRCSATMLTSKVVLTAGHCTNNFGNTVHPGPFTGMRIFTESDVESGRGITNSYPTCDLGNCIEAKSWAAHPLYETAPFYVHDVGVVILQGKGFDPGVYGTLPAQDSLDALSPGASTIFTAVGYGLQRSGPDPSGQTVGSRTRMVAYPKLDQINTGFTGPGSLLLSNNANTGGTCFGDSGGPNFLGSSSTVAGVTSFGLNGSCGGTGGVFRMDRADVLQFVKSFLPKNY